MRRVDGDEMRMWASYARAVRRAAVPVFAAILVVGVIYYMQNEEQAIEKIKRLKPQPDLVVGEVVPKMSISVIYPNGEATIIPNDEQTYLVMIYSPKCSLCESSWLTWNRLAGSSELSQRVRTIALSTMDAEATIANARRHGAVGKIGLFRETLEGKAYRISRLPATLYIERRKIGYIRYGPLGAKEEGEILRVCLHRDGDTQTTK